MGAKNTNQLLERYYTWEKVVFGASILLIFWKFFGLMVTTTIPVANATLRDPNKLPSAISIILLVSTFFLWMEWKQSDESARQTMFSKFRYCISFVIAIFAVWMNLNNITRGTFLEGVSGIWFLLYFLMGLSIASVSSTLVLASLMIRVEGGKGGRTQKISIPIATKCVYRGLWPIVIIILAANYVTSCYAPFPLLRAAPLITAFPIICITIAEIKRYFLSYDENGKRIPFQQRISGLKEIFKTHDYMRFLAVNTERIMKEAKISMDAAPKQLQQGVREYSQNTFRNITLRSRINECLDFVSYPKDGDANNKSPENLAVRVEIENSNASTIEVEVSPKGENPPKKIRKCILKLSCIEKHAAEFLRKNFERPVSSQMLFSYAIDHAVEDFLFEEAKQNLPLHQAAMAGRQDVIERFISIGQDVNERAPNGWTPLMAAVAQGYPKLVKFLLDNGANPDISNLQKITPLMYAARYGNIEIAKMLIDYGAKLNLEDIYGETALAVGVRTGHEQIVRMLISKGAKVDTRSKLKNLSPLDLAHRHGYGKIAKLLRKSLSK